MFRNRHRRGQESGYRKHIRRHFDCVLFATRRIPSARDTACCYDNDKTEHGSYSNQIRLVPVPRKGPSETITVAVLVTLSLFSCF